jgi:hypothetical protein
MIQQSLTRSVFSQGALRGRSKRIPRLGALACLSLAGLLVGGTLPTRAFSQYAQAPQTNSMAAYPAPTSTSGGSSDAVQFAGQTDEQLASEARLFQQQGRTAQAQRVYLELQRRSLIRLQSQQTPALNRMPSSFYASNGSTVPVGGISTSAMNPTTGMPNGPGGQSQTAARGFASPNRQFQPTPQFQSGRPSSQTAAAWMPPSPDNQTADRENFSLPVVEGSSPVAAQTSVETAIGAPQPIAAAPTSGDSGESSSEKTSVMVLDRQVAQPTPQVEKKANGWRPAVTPLPAALVQGKPVAKPASEPVAGLVSNATVARQPEIRKTAQLNAKPTNAEQPSTTHASIQPAVADAAPVTPMQPMELARKAVSDPVNELPNIPVQPLPDLPSASPGAVKSPMAFRLGQEPAAFAPPATLSERRLPAATAAEQPGVVDLPATAPPVLELSPRSVPRAASVQPEQESANSIPDTAAKLARQTDEIRIIPNYRGTGHSTLESLLSPGHDEQSASPDAAFNPPVAGWKSYMPTEPRSQGGADASPSNATHDAGAANDQARPEQSSDQPTAQGRVRADSIAGSGEATELRRNQPAGSSQVVDEKRPEPKPVFDLAELIKDPEFREIHTRPVLDALELLSQADPRHRLLGALRIGVSGSEARTALPALRQLLGAEPKAAVRLRVAEAILKLQPNDRAALDSLSQSLIDPNNAELRQAAAGALGGAAATSSPIAIVRLTDALDDPSPRVRIMAALSLAQFGPAAIDAVPRLEIAASKDVPRMQRAALAALASIRGRQDEQESGLAASPAVDSRMSVVPPALPPTERLSATPTSVDGAGLDSNFTDRGSSENRAGSPPAFFPDLQPTPGALRKLEPRATAAGDAPGSGQLWQTIPARGISLHELGSDGANPEARLRHQPEPAGLPDVPARPLEQSGEPVTPRAATGTPKPIAPPPSPLSDDSPLNLEPQSGGSKAGSPP